MTPRNWPISSSDDVGAELARGLAALDPRPAPLARLGRGDGEPALAQVGVGLQAAPELEIDREPVGLVLRHRLEQRVEPLLGEECVEALVVLRGEREEELLLGREPVEDRAAGEADLPLEPDDRRALVAVAGKAAPRTFEHARAAGVLLCVAQVRHGIYFTKQYVRLILLRHGRPERSSTRRAPRRHVRRRPARLAGARRRHAVRPAAARGDRRPRRRARRVRAAARHLRRQPRLAHLAPRGAARAARRPGADRGARPRDLRRAHRRSTRRRTRGTPPASTPSGCTAIQGAYRPAFERIFRHEVRWVGCQYPTPALAQDAGMATDEFADFLYGACLLDWDAERDADAALRRPLRRGRRGADRRRRTPTSGCRSPAAR